MIKKYCDRCNKDMGIVYSMPLGYGCAPVENRERPLMEDETMTITLGSIADAKMRMVDLCEKCYVAVKEFIFNPEPVMKNE
jgi:hypothetical protein